MSTERLTRLSWIATLQGIAQKADADAATIYRAILLHVVRGFEAKSGCLAVRDPHGPHLRIVAGIDLPPGVIGSEVAMGAGVLGWVAEYGTALLLNGSVANDPRFATRITRTESSRPGSSLCWPLRVHNDVVGVVSVNRPAGQSEFDQGGLDQGSTILTLVGLALTNIRLREEQQRRIEALHEANVRLEETRHQLVQSEKMASVGQLAAGVAHEINNPIGFVTSNLGSLERCVSRMFEMFARYEAIGAALPPDSLLAGELAQDREELEFLRDDLPALIRESRDGLARVKKIVENLKEFSHSQAEDEFQPADLRACIEMAIGIALNELKYKCELSRDYGEIPPVECLPGQIGQVVLNMLVNASQAIEDKGRIAVRTRHVGDWVEIEIADTGHGIPADQLTRIFEPFFTTKPVGQGTGLGLSISYGIVHKHHGEIKVASDPGRGTTFTVRLPLTQPRVATDGDASGLWHI